MKINVDAALAKNSRIVAAAAVARDMAGRFLGASGVVSEGRMEPDTVEAIACKEGLALASDLVLRDFRLACDNVGVIRSIKEGSMGTYGHVVQEIRARSNDFSLVDFVHERRQSNTDAHNLARSCVYAELGRHVWLLSPPDGVCTSHETQ
jgi:ribonuclease HI